jgi:hypothetical protein
MMISVLIYVLCAVLIAWLAVYLIQTLGVQEPFRSVAIVLIIVILILTLVGLIIPWPGVVHLR